MNVIASDTPNVNNTLLDNIRNKIASTVQGNKNVPTLYGHIDVMTSSHIYVIKTMDQWCSGIGILEIFHQSFPNKTKCLHLYNMANTPNLLNKMITITKSMRIELTVEQ